MTWIHYWVLVFCLSTQAYAPQRGSQIILEEHQEQEAQRIGKNIRCAVCQGLSVADSPAPMAQAMMDKVRELVSMGQTQTQINQYFIDRYGEWILLKPQPHGFNLIVWWIPVLGFVLGVLWIFSLTLRKKNRSP